MWTKSGRLGSSLVDRAVENRGDEAFVHVSLGVSLRVDTRREYFGRAR